MMLLLLTLQPMENVMNAVSTGFKSWGLLILGLAILAVVISLLNKLFKPKD